MSSARPATSAAIADGPGDDVRDQPHVEVDQRDRHERGHEQQPEHDADRLVLRADDEREQHGGQQLDGRVADRERLPAGAAAAAQQQPAEHRDVVAGLDRRLAVRAVRARTQQRLLAREPVDDDVQERPDRQAEDEREGDVDGIHGVRKLDEGADTAAERARRARRPASRTSQTAVRWRATRCRRSCSRRRRRCCRRGCSRRPRRA